MLKLDKIEGKIQNKKKSYYEHVFHLIDRFKG